MLRNARLRVCTTIEKELQVGGSTYRARYLFRTVTRWNLFCWYELVGRTPANSRLRDQYIVIVRKYGE